MRRLSHRSAAAFPQLLAREDAGELIDRWEALFVKAPRLCGWLEQELGRHRLLLEESVACASPAEVDRTLREQLGRWLIQFESLPQFTISAIATTLEDDDAHSAAARRARLGDADGAHLADSAASTPERAACDLEMLLSDPVFALAFHCVEVRVRPRIAAALHNAPGLARVPETAWFGLLHACAPANPLLTPAVAVGLVLRVLGAEWTRLPARSRNAALRLFNASSIDLCGHGADEAVRRLCDSLPSAWQLLPQNVPDFVAAAAHARVALADASGLCSRIAASVACAARRPLRGAFALLQQNGGNTAGPEEVAELAETARKHAEMAGFRRLLSLL